jgi:NAD(P)-dependent dehydrogenase (short-subunit alcohol dehydrogenase family)
MPSSFDCQIAAVTGAGSGLGLAIAQALVADGAFVYCLDVSGQQNNAAETLAPNAAAVQVDVTDADSLDRAVDEILTRHGRLSVMCNCAGIEGPIRRVGNYPLDAWNAVLAVNLTGVFLGMRAAIRAMDHGGSIVNISSIGASVAVPMMGAYTAAKAAVEQLTRVAAVEYGPKNIRVNSVAPGAIRTPMTTQASSVIDHLVAITPLRRTASVAEVAAVVKFLASDQSAFVTGQSIIVDGGLTLPLPGTQNEIWESRSRIEEDA